MPTITHIHAAVIPLLAGRGHVLVDARAHRTIYDGCAVARGQGVIMHRFHAEDIGGLEELLGAIPATRSRLVCMDGVNSMTGNVPDLAAVARVCRRYDALLYVDDAHGFGVLGDKLFMTTLDAHLLALDMKTGSVVWDVVLGDYKIGYAATIALLVVDGRRLVTVFAPVGRMALTNYLMHSIVCVTLSYGFGLGLWWHIGASRAMAIAALIIAIQIPLSALWLSRYRFGPVEWIWRRLTYRRPI